jgi:predicted PurR-regulated permease PerM
MSAEMTRFVRRAFAAVLIVGLVVLLAYAVELILYVFAGILLALMLRTAGMWLAATTGVSIRWSMTIVLVVFVFAVFATIWAFGLQIAHQADELFDASSKAYSQFQSKLQQYRIFRQFVSTTPTVSLGETATAAAAGLMWMAASVALILFLGVYLSTGPQEYLESFLNCFSAEHRAKASRILESLGGALRWWLVGQFIAMLVVGIVTTTGLFLLDSPMPVALGVMAGLLTFVPYVGALASAVPAILIAFTQSSHLALYVMLLYLLAHIVEGYIVVPLVQHKLVYLPPALILTSQLFMHAFAGAAGLMFATPLMVVAMVLIKRLYFKQDWTD